MAILKKNELNELVGGDMYSSGGDRNPVSNSEIETGPVQKPFNDDSNYEKGESTTTDKVFARYRQNIPWFAVYSYGGRGGRGGGVNENNTVITKQTMEERIEDLVKKTKSSEVSDKNRNQKLDNLISTIKNNNFTDEDLDELSNTIADKKSDNTKIKNI